VPHDLARRVALSSRIAEVLDVAAIALECNAGAELAAVGYYRLCDMLDLEWLDRRLAEAVPRDRWEKRVVLGLTEDLMAMRHEFALQVLATHQEETVDAAAAIDAYLVTHQAELIRIGELIDDVTTAPRVTLAALSVVIRAIGRLGRVGV
jgi:NAD-specific glutamate dehydrogenase